MKARIKVMQIGDKHWALRNGGWTRAYVTSRDVQRHGGWIEALMADVKHDIARGRRDIAANTLAAIRLA